MRIDDEAPYRRRLRRLAAAVAGRLIGDPRVMRAIGQAGQRLAAAEEEFRTGGIADRPVAGGLVEFQQRQPLAHRHHVVVGDRIRLQSRLRTHAPARCCRARPGATTRIMCWAGRALRWRGAAEEGLLARPERPSRWTLPITAFRVTFPSSAAIWLAESPAFPEFLQLLDAIVGPGQYRHRILPFASRRPFGSGAATPKFPQKSLLAESLSPRRARKARPNVYAEHWDGRGSELPHEMSYPTAQKLQYGVTPAQESAAERPHVPSAKHCNSIFPRHRSLRGEQAAPRPVDSYRRAHRMVPRAAPKRRHVLFSGLVVDAIAPMRASRPSPNLQ